MSGYMTTIKYKDNNIKRNFMNDIKDKYEIYEINSQESYINAKLSNNDIQTLKSLVSPSSYIIKIFDDNKLEAYASDGILKYSAEYIREVSKYNPEKFPIETCVGSFSFLNSYLDKFYDKFLERNKNTKYTQWYLDEYTYDIAEHLNEEINNMLSLNIYDFVCSCDQL